MVDSKRGNGWSEWQNHVLCELERLSMNIDKLTSVIYENRAELAALKAKAAMWGAISGGIFSAIVVGLMSFFSSGK